MSCSCTVDYWMSLNEIDFTATCLHYTTVLLPNSSTCKFHPCCLYCQIPVLANSTPAAFTGKFITCNFHAGKKLFYFQIPVLANSCQAYLLSESSTCNFHYLQIHTTLTSYLKRNVFERKSALKVLKSPQIQKNRMRVLSPKIINTH